SLICLMYLTEDSTYLDMTRISLHDAIPILRKMSSHSSVRSAMRTSFLAGGEALVCGRSARATAMSGRRAATRELYSDTGTFRKPDRKSTRLNSSHVKISYTDFCLYKNKIIE